MTTEEIYDKEFGVGSFADLSFEEARRMIAFGGACKLEGIKTLSKELDKNKS